MYLKERLIRGLKVKNAVFVALGVFLLGMAVWAMTDLTVHYYPDWDTILHARRTPESLVYFVVGVLLTVYSRVSRKLINDATFFSRYFEGDLSGFIPMEELAEISGRSFRQIRRRLKLLRPLYMRNFRFSAPDASGAGEQIELESKTVSCVCRSCGGALEKRAYFVGTCPWCGSSDLTARVLSGGRFYCIRGDEQRRVNEPDYYRGRRLGRRMALIALGLSLALLAVVISLILFLVSLSRLNDPDKLTLLLLSGWHHRSSFALIKAELRDSMMLDLFVMLSAGSAIPVLLTRAAGIRRALRLSRCFAGISTPFVELSQLPGAGGGNARRELKGLVGCIREGYLKGCAPELHGGPLRIGLAKRVVKDRCPSCAAPITGAVDEHYRCRYCGNLILEVIRKR